MQEIEHGTEVNRQQSNYTISRFSALLFPYYSDSDQKTIVFAVVRLSAVRLGSFLLGRAAPGRGVRGGETAKTAAVADLVSPYTPAPHRLCRPLPVKRRLGAQLRLAAATADLAART